MTIRLRIFLFNLVSVFIATFVVALIGLKIVESTVIDSTYERLTQIRINKFTAIEGYFRDLQTVSNLIRVHELTDDILASTSDSSYMPFRRLLDNYALDFNIYDLALINNQGRVVYTTRKGFPDGINVRSLPTENNRLKEIFAWGQKAEEDSFLFADFTEKKAEGKSPSACLGSPIFKNGRRIGVMAIKISMSEIDHITSDNFSWSTNGMGQTGETLVYGENWTLRNTGRFLNEVPIPDGASPKNLSLRGDENIKEIESLNELRDTGTDYRGKKVIRSTGKIYLPNGQIWFIQSKIDEAEAFAVLDRIAIASSAAAILIFILFFFFTFAATAKVVEPIQLLTESLEKLGTTNLSKKINYQSKDEIGLLVNQYNKLADRLEATTVSKEFLDSVIQSIKAFLFIVKISKDPSTGQERFQILQANESALNILNLSDSEISEKNLKSLIRFNENPGDFNRLLRSHNSIEAQFCPTEGPPIPILMNWAALPQLTGRQKPTFVFVCTDITDRKNAEKALIEAREGAVKASQAKSEFLARMSHEIRTPLNSIIGITDVLAESDLNSDQEKLVRVCANAGENLLSLVNDILDISKIEAREVKLERIVFDIGVTTRTICDILKQKALEKSLDFNLKIYLPPGPSLRVIGDPTRIRQILFNLIGNAIKFTHKGSISVTLDFEDPTHNFLRFSIADTGTGIPKDKQHLLFQNFVQADSSITRRYGGSGLGLTISKNLVELMGGRIWFESEVGRGSSFSFAVPYQPTQDPIEEKPMHDSSQPVNIPAGKLKILVVDDTDDNRFLFITYLKHFAFDISQAENGKEAVRKVQQENFDIVFMDIQMPIMDGYAATQQIRAWEKQQGREAIPIVAVSANAMSEDIQKSLQAGCTEHVTKPLKKSALIELVQRYFPKK
jgi:signal transduction histidine kinase/HAMP domain-containing protein